MPESLTDRQETVLALIVHEYIESAKPVGSKSLLEKYQLGVSSATIRNEMNDLTQFGYLRQPHTSAGRIPTEEGYRYFVQSLLGDTELPPEEKRLISHQFHQARAEVDEWTRLAASVLAQHSRVASLVSTPTPSRAVLKHLELIGTQGRQVLMVIVLEGGDVRQQMLTLAEVVEQERLSLTAERIARHCRGKSSQSLQSQAAHFDELENDLLKLVVEVLQHADDVLSGEIHRDGLSNVLSQPEFAQGERGRQALHLLEEMSLLEEVLSNALVPSISGVQVVIGGEGAWEELKDCSMVLARYGAPGYATGALGVLGPTRMAYARNISAVRYVAGLMSDLLIELFAD